MIAIVSIVARECAALAALCGSRAWPTAECDSLRSFRRLLHRAELRVAVVRHQLADGFSDDILGLLAAANHAPAAKIVVLLGAGAPACAEARQVALGADCVQRDPMRPEVLLAYLEKYIDAARQTRRSHRPRSLQTVAFVDGALGATERTLHCGSQTIPLTPRETALAETLALSHGEVLTYDTLYNEVLGCPFRGDTSNMRVLLGKLSCSLETAGIDLRRWVQVIPKTGYRYRDPAR